MTMSARLDGRTGVQAWMKEGRRVVPAHRHKNDILITHAYYLSATKLERKTMMPYVPLGPLYVAAALKENGYRVQFFDTTFLPGTEDFARSVEETRPAIVGIYAIETTRGNAFDMMHSCRMLGIPVIAGGPDPSSDPALYLERGAYAVVAGEGEETMVELMEAMGRGSRNLSSLRGVHTREGFGGHRAPIAGIDALPFPARTMADLQPYFETWRRHHRMTSLQMYMSRGCPCTCSWCAKPVFGSSYRVRSPEKVVEEMFFLKMIYNPDRLSFADDVFGCDAAWVARFCDEVARKKARIPFECSTRVALAERETLQRMKEAGCLRIWYGVESGSPKVLSSMGACFDVADIKRAARLTREAGIEVGFSLTLGHPAESVSDIELTRALIRETRPDHCGVSIAYPLRGSQFYREVEKDLLPVWHMERYEDDHILTFRSRYSQNYYDMARALIGSEARLYSRPRAGLVDRIRHGVYQVGYGIMSNGLR